MKFLKKMKFNIKIIMMVFTLLLSACQSVKDGLTLQKRNNPDEFLVEKKNPLILPPNYSELPVPAKKNSEKTNEDKNQIQLIITKSDSSITTNENQKVSDDLEKNILDKIIQK